MKGNGSFFHLSKQMTDFDKHKILGDCGHEALGTYKAIDEKDIKGILSIEDLLQKNDFEKHIGSFEIPSNVAAIMSIDEMNAVISWYLPWKLKTPFDKQNTCTIKDTFGWKDGLKAIIAINFYKYLRNKGYDPEVVEIFLSKQ
jgi:hypothetical protein